MRESSIESGKIMSECRCSLSMMDLDCPLHGTAGKAYTQPPTEMTSLREIKDKLDALAESQGKLLARLDAMDAGLHETAMRNHQQVLFETGQISAGAAGQVARLQLDLREALEKLVPGYDPFGRKAKPRKPSKKARSAAGKAR